jgi:hypothetical protein
MKIQKFVIISIMLIGIAGCGSSRLGLRDTNTYNDFDQLITESDSTSLSNPEICATYLDENEIIDLQPVEVESFAGGREWGVDKDDYYIHDITPPGDKAFDLYEYKIWFGNQGIISGTTTLREPMITELDDGILRLQISYGTNHSDIQYFDTFNGISSEPVEVNSGYADYICSYDNKYLLAYFAYSDIVQRDTVVLKIINIFDGSTFAIIERDFYDSPSHGAETMIFLSDSEIYIDYESKSSIETYTTTGQLTTTREIICFQQVDNPISIVYRTA